MTLRFAASLFAAAWIFAAGGAAKSTSSDKPQQGGGEVDELKRQLEEMQKRIERLSTKSE